VEKEKGVNHTKKRKIYEIKDGGEKNKGNEE
jgi:hypothetical protein